MKVKLQSKQGKYIVNDKNCCFRVHSLKTHTFGCPENSKRVLEIKFHLKVDLLIVRKKKNDF